MSGIYASDLDKTPLIQKIEKKNWTKILSKARIIAQKYSYLVFKR